MPLREMPGPPASAGAPGPASSARASDSPLATRHSLENARRNCAGMERIAHGADCRARVGTPRPRAWGRTGGPFLLSRPEAAAAGLARWAAPGRAVGDRRGPEPFLPPTGWTWQTTIEEGYWRNLEAVY